jgi:integrase
MEEVRVKTCKKNHTEPRNQFDQCPVCVRESRAKYKKSHTAKARRAALLPVATATAATAPASVIPHSFLAVARKWMASQDNVRPSTAKKREFLLDQLSALHAIPMSTLTTPTIVRALSAIEAVRDRRETAHRCGQLVGQITRYAVNHEYAAVNVLPLGQLRGALKPVKATSHAAIIEPERFGTLLKMIDLYADFTSSRAQPGVAPALQLAPLLFLRPGELRKLEWSEVNFDKKEIVLPPEKMKQGKPHVVPLAKQALLILRAAHEETGTHNFAFRTKRKDEPLSDNGFREALVTILGAMGEPRDAATMHGFRSSASTLLNGELGIDSALIELQLAHVKGDRVAGIYDRSQRLPERRAMMQAWANYLDKLKSAAK